MKVIKTLMTASNGQFPGYEIPLGHFYNFTFEKPGYTKIVLAVDAKKNYFPAYLS